MILNAPVGSVYTDPNDLGHTCHIQANLVNIISTELSLTHWLLGDVEVTELILQVLFQMFYKLTSLAVEHFLWN